MIAFDFASVLRRNPRVDGLLDSQFVPVLCPRCQAPGARPRFPTAGFLMRPPRWPDDGDYEIRFWPRRAPEGSDPIRVLVHRFFEPNGRAVLLVPSRLALLGHPGFIPF